MARRRRDPEWSDYHLSPIPFGAPPFVITGQPHMPMRVVGYADRDARTSTLDERWAIDVTVVSAAAAPDHACGELVLFVGDRGRSWWSPAPILRVTERAAGKVELTTLRDRSMPVRDADAMERDLPELLLAVDGPLPIDLHRAALDQWELDVWCPECGALGQPILYGEPPGNPNTLRGADGRLNPWPAGSWELGGCVRGWDDPGYRCPRCGHGWGGALGRRKRTMTAESFADVLRLTQCDETPDLEALLTEYAGERTWISFEDEPDPDSGFELIVGTLGVHLTCPIPLPELWDAVDDLLQTREDARACAAGEDPEVIRERRAPRPWFAQD